MVKISSYMPLDPLHDELWFDYCILILPLTYDWSKVKDKL